MQKITTKHGKYFSLLKVVVPARYVSSRFPGKPLLLLNGKPMYWHVVQRVIEAGVALNDIVVATDDDRIVQSAISESIPVQIISSKDVSGTDRINEVVTANKWDDNVAVLNVQGDEPLIPSVLIVDLI
ncbi:MAG: NTP transferase domain-containing protein [Marinomonas sp.]